MLIVELFLVLDEKDRTAILLAVRRVNIALFERCYYRQYRAVIFHLNY